MADELSALAPPPLTRSATFLSPAVIDSYNRTDDNSNSNISSTSNNSNNGSAGKLSPTEVFGGSRKGAKQYQEDSFMYWSSPNNVITVGSVFDGHGGYNGMLASNTARDFALNFFNKQATSTENWNEEEWKAQLLNLFNEMHETIRTKFVNDLDSEGNSNNEKRFVDEKGIVRSVLTQDPIHGGTTCTIVVQIRDRNGIDVTLITANVGDSTTLILPHHSKCEFLSVDHGPENEDEFARIDALPSSSHPLKLLLVYDKTNVYRKYECPAVFRSDGVRDPVFVNNPWANGLHPTNVRYEPAVYAVTPRVVSRDSTCIAMTRALGDFYAHQFGLTAIPSLTVKKIKLDQDQFSVVVASDGIWDCWRYEDFASFCNVQIHEKKLDLQKMGDLTLDESINRAIANFGAKHYDDACAVVWRIN